MLLIAITEILFKAIEASYAKHRFALFDYDKKYRKLLSIICLSQCNIK